MYKYWEQDTTATITLQITNKHICTIYQSHTHTFLVFSRESINKLNSNTYSDFMANLDPRQPPNYISGRLLN